MGIRVTAQSQSGLKFLEPAALPNLAAGSLLGLLPRFKTHRMKIDLVLPRGRHSWNLGEGWVESLQRAGYLGRVFRLDDQDPDSIVSLATKEEADMTILMGGDHHLEALHDTPQKRAAWNRSRVPRIAFCYESILDSRFARSLEKSGAAVEAFTHFVYCDEKDEAFFADRKAPALWLPQCVDHRRFLPGSGVRKPKVFFRGKNDLGLHYNQRQQLIERLKQSPAFTFVPDEMSDEALMAAYAEYACVINLPGNFFGYNVRTFEALAAGAVLFQYKLGDRPKTDALFTNQHLIPFNADDPESLVKKMEEVVENLGDYQKIADQGRELCLAEHTIDRRVAQIIDFVDSSYQTANRLHIGCGKNILPNYVNIDALPHDRRVVVQDASTLENLPEGRYESIYACHVLEHFAYAQIESVLAAWAKKLGPGGKLYLAVPDMRFLTLAYVLGAPTSRVWPPLFGGQEYPTNFHYVGFDRKTLTSLLKKVGFSRVSLFEPNKQPFARWDCSSWPLSLNLVAEKTPLDAHPKGELHFWWRQKRILMKRYGKGLRRFLKGQDQ
jgi:predicted SAM-dependent methyltransferase